MRKWYVPATLVGLSGLGILMLTDPGQAAIRWLLDNFQKGPKTFIEWNEAAQRELDRIQTALNRVASTLDAVQPTRPV